MPFTTVMTTAADVDDSILQDYDKQFLIASADEGIMEQLVTYRRVIEGESTNFKKYSQLGLETTPLTEDEDKASEALVDSPIVLTPQEFGKVVTTTKLANLQTGGVADLAAARLVGINAGRSLDKQAVLVAEASANELVVTGGLESALTASDVITASFLNKLYN